MSFDFIIQTTPSNVNLTSINGVVIAIFAGPAGPSRRLLSITGGFRAEIWQEVSKGGAGENKNGVTTALFSGQECKILLKMASEFHCREDFSAELA